MRALVIPLFLCAALLAAGQAAAQEEGYYVKVTPHAPEGPFTHGPEGYDCTGGAGPEGLAQSAAYDVDALTDGTRWGLPYVGPTCLAADARAPPPGGVPTWCPVTPMDSKFVCISRFAPGTFYGMTLPGLAHLLGLPVLEQLGAGEGEPRVRATYDLSTGRYHVEWSAPTPLTRTGLDVPRSVDGDTGLSILFDCRDCEPPW